MTSNHYSFTQQQQRNLNTQAYYQQLSKNSADSSARTQERTREHHRYYDRRLADNLEIKNNAEKLERQKNYQSINKSEEVPKRQPTFIEQMNAKYKVEIEQERKKKKEQ
jgi:hypothetical protein